jgi:hypothetical protein
MVCTSTCPRRGLSPHTDGEAFTDDSPTSGETAAGFGIFTKSTPPLADAAVIVVDPAADLEAV